MSRRLSLAVAVVDGGGHIVASQRMDGTALGAAQLAIGKAYTSVLWGTPTGDFMESTQPGGLDAVALGQLTAQVGATQVGILVEAATRNVGDRVDDPRVGQLGPGRLGQVERLDAGERFAFALGGVLAQHLRHRVMQGVPYVISGQKNGRGANRRAGHPIACFNCLTSRYSSLAPV